MTSQPVAAAEALWRQFVAADQQYRAKRADLLRAIPSNADLSSLLRSALSVVGERAAVLRLLSTLDESVRRALLPELTYLAAFGHRDILLVREVFLSFDREWLEQHLPSEIEQVLRGSNPYEEYRRLAELLRVLRSSYLATLVEHAALSENADIREVAEDFGATDAPFMES